MFSHARLNLFLLAVSLLLLTAKTAMAQNPIRVQSDQVLVPTVVFDQKLYAQLNKMKAHHRDYYAHIVAKNQKLWDNITVKNLTAKDFHLYEDGQEQKIQSVRLESPVLRVVEDNLGKHPETIGTGGGVWSYPDLPATEQTTWLALPQYAIAYAPAKSAPGSCHQIQVKAVRANLVVWSRSEYCNTPHPPTDPLKGSALGKKVEEAMASDQQDKIDLKMKVATFPKASGALVYVTLDFPWRSLKHEYRGGTLYATIGMLIVVYNKDGTVADRRSDFACCDYGDEKQANPGARPVAATEGRSLIPDRYRTDFDLAAGEYNVRVVLSDGENFGRQQVQMTVQDFDPKQLEISDVVLSRRVRKLSPDTADSERAAESYMPLVSKGVEFTPTANTEFRKDETLVAFFEINEPPEELNTKVHAQLRIVDAQSGEVVNDFEPVDAAIYQRAGNQAIAIGRGMPLSGLLVGAYQLEVQASEADGRSTPWRTARFTVTPAELREENPSLPLKKDEVIVNVSALDSNGHAVTNLTSADFQILDEEKPQAITSFKVASPQSAPTLRKRTASENRSDGGEDTEMKTSDLEGFVPPIVILFDLMNTPWSKREYIANRLINLLNPLETDEGIYLYLLTTDGELYPVRPHGTGQAAAIEQGSIAGGGDHEKPGDVPWTKAIRPLLMQAINEVHGFRDEDFQIEAWRAPLTFRRLSELQDDFSAVRGPKTLLWITGGAAINVPSFCENNVISSATGTYVSGTCYVICQLPKAADMAATMGSCMDHTPFLEHFSTEAVAADTVVSSVAVTATGLQDFEVGKPAYSLARLADLTGGQIYMNTDADAEKALLDAVDARKTRYRLTFAAPVRDGKYHKLRVLCTRAGAHVAGPRGYFAVAR
jgi:VWFA-related protein